MSPLHGWPLAATGALLMTMGLAMLWVSLTRHGRRARARLRAGGLPVALTCTSLGGGVIAAVEWLVLSRSGPGAVWVAVLAVPAFLAAATVTRVVVIARTLHLCRQERVIRHDRGCRR